MWTVDVLQAILADNPDVEVQAHACFSLATILKNSGNNEHAIAEAELLFQRVQENYPEVEWEGKKLAQRAADQLASLRGAPRLGHAAPDIVGIDLEGKRLQLSDYKGRVVVLNFWASWSPPCLKMIPAERELVGKMAGQPFALLGVNADADLPKAAEVIRAEKINWPSFKDGGAGGRIASFWGVQALPTTFILDAEQRIRFKNIPIEEVERVVKDLLREIPPNLR